MVITDTFDRADNASLGAPWATMYGGDGPCRILSNAAAPIATGDQFSGAIYTGASFAQNQYTRITLGGISGNWVAMLLHITNPTTSAYSGYILLRDGTTGIVSMRTITNNVESSDIATWTGLTPVDGDNWQFSRISSTTLQFLINGALVVPTTGTMTDSTYLAGNPGFWVYQGSRVTAWEGGDDAVSARPITYYAQMRA